MDVFRRGAPAGYQIGRSFTDFLSMGVHLSRRSIENTKADLSHSVFEREQMRSANGAERSGVDWTLPHIKLIEFSPPRLNRGVREAGEGGPGGVGWRGGWNRWHYASREISSPRKIMQLSVRGRPRRTNHGWRSRRMSECRWRQLRKSDSVGRREEASPQRWLRSLPTLPHCTALLDKQSDPSWSGWREECRIAEGRGRERERERERASWRDHCTGFLLHRSA